MKQAPQSALTKADGTHGPFALGFEVHGCELSSRRKTERRGWEREGTQGGEERRR